MTRPRKTLVGVAPTPTQASVLERIKNGETITCCPPIYSGHPKWMGGETVGWSTIVGLSCRGLIWSCPDREGVSGKDFGEYEEPPPGDFWFARFDQTLKLTDKGRKYVSSSL